VALLASAGLAACTTTLHGYQSSGGVSATTTGASLSGHAGAAGVSAAASFGSPAPAQGAGGQIVFSRGASAVLILGVVLADMLNNMARGTGTASEAAAMSIADTCSCYRPQPEQVQSGARTGKPDER
jgi:hypothetical protein